MQPPVVVARNDKTEEPAPEKPKTPTSKAPTPTDLVRLEKLANQMHTLMLIGTPSEREDFLRAVLPTREDLVAVYPQHGEVIWPHFEGRYAATPVLANYYCAEFYLKGCLDSLTTWDARTEKVKYLLDRPELISSDMPYFGTRMRCARSELVLSWAQIGDRWVLLDGAEYLIYEIICAERERERAALRRAALERFLKEEE